MGAEVALASAGMSVLGSLAQGQSQSNQFAAEASRLRVAASAARLRAGQTDLQYRQQISEAGGNLFAARAERNVGLDSPTGLVLGNHVRERMGNQRAMAVADQEMQARGLDSQAQMARAAGRAALTASFITAGTQAFSAVAGSPALRNTLSSGISTIGDAFDRSFGFRSVSFG